MVKVCLCLFVLATAAITSFGRANFAIGQVLANRYQLYSSLFPIVMVSMIIGESGITNLSGKIIFAFLFLGILLGIGFGWDMGLHQGRDWKSGQEENRKILYSFETMRDEQLQQLHNPFMVRKRAAILKDLRYNVFKNTDE